LPDSNGVIQNQNRGAKKMDIEERRWTWYFDALSPETRKFMYALPEPEWQAWLIRASELSAKLHIPDIHKMFPLPLEWYEQECYIAMLASLPKDSFNNPDMGHFVALLRDFGGSKKVQEHFALMTNQQWADWKHSPRYRAIVEGRGENLKPPMEWWEREFDEVMIAATNSKRPPANPQ
jgi:hypothetical protein